MSWLVARFPGVTTPQGSAPVLASLAVDGRWADLCGGAFVVIGTVTEVVPVANDRERRLWEATDRLLQDAAASA